MEVIIGHPWLEVSIATENGNLSLRGSSAPRGNLNSEVISVNTKRDLANDNVVFNIELVYRDHWFKVLRPNDLVKITICQPPKSGELVVCGLIDDIRDTASIHSNSPYRSVSIMGRGFNKALVNFELGVLTEIENNSDLFNPVQQVMMTLPYNVEGWKVVDTLWNELLLKHENYEFSNGETFSTLARKSLSTRPEAILMHQKIWSRYQGNLWNLYKELKSEPFHELFWEVLDGFPTLVMRPTPFNQTEWEALQQTTIELKDLVDTSVGISDLETYSVYQVQPGASEVQLSRAVTEVKVKPFWNPNYYKKYGLRALTVQSIYQKFFNSDDASSGKPLLESLQTDLYNWYIKNNVFANGSVTLRGNPEIKLGTRILNAYDGMEYYCEGVTHDFVVGDYYTTELELTRGCKSSDRFSSPWGTYEEYSYDKILSMNQGGTI